ncbi:MAG: hypothetical protein M2R46_00316 [Verrucomicrobia subdivision 3 bacterium]|nr:hypothetical protein [Limisphaerales bacterium]
MHPNGVESFWPMLKRAYRGTFHKISPRHLNQCIQGFSSASSGLRQADTLAQMTALAVGFVGRRHGPFIADNGLPLGKRRHERSPRFKGVTPEALARAWLRAIKFLSVIALVGEASGYQRILREAPRERLSLRNSSPPGLSLGRCPSGFIGSRLGAWFGVHGTNRPSVMGPCTNHAARALKPGRAGRTAPPQSSDAGSRVSWPQIQRRVRGFARLAACGCLRDERGRLGEASCRRQVHEGAIIGGHAAQRK